MPLMMMTVLPDALRRLLRPALAAVLVALGGCGPGTGGTGTGPLSFTVGPYMASTVTPEVNPALGVLRDGCLTDCASAAQLTLDDTSAELRTACTRFTRTGAWSTDENHAADLAGTLETFSASGTRTSSAVLRLQFAGDPAQAESATATVFDASGRAVLGPLTLARGPASMQQGSGTAATCPP